MVSFSLFFPAPLHFPSHLDLCLFCLLLENSLVRNEIKSNKIKQSTHTVIGQNTQISKGKKPKKTHKKQMYREIHLFIYFFGIS